MRLWEERDFGGSFRRSVLTIAEPRLVTTVAGHDLGEVPGHAIPEGAPDFLPALTSGWKTAAGWEMVRANYLDAMLTGGALWR